MKMNKYQEALIYFCNGCHHEQEEGEYGACKRVEGRCKHYRSLKELVDKATPKKPEQHSQIWNIFMCPNCHCAVDGTYQKYCEECGQRLEY